MPGNSANSLVTEIMPLLPCLLPRATDLWRALVLFKRLKPERPERNFILFSQELVKAFCLCCFLIFSACLPTATEGIEKKNVSFSVPPVLAFHFLSKLDFSHPCLLGFCCCLLSFCHDFLGREGTSERNANKRCQILLQMAKVQGVKFQ